MSDFKKHLKMRDLKRIFKRVAKEIGDDGLLAEVEDYLREKIIDTLIDEITDNEIYQKLIKSLLDEIEDEL